MKYLLKLIYAKLEDNFGTGKVSFVDKVLVIQLRCLDLYPQNTYILGMCDLPGNATLMRYNRQTEDSWSQLTRLVVLYKLQF